MSKTLLKIFIFVLSPLIATNASTMPNADVTEASGPFRRSFMRVGKGTSKVKSNFQTTDRSKRFRRTNASISVCSRVMKYKVQTPFPKTKTKNRKPKTENGKRNLQNR